jgi:hypothetical protein
LLLALTAVDECVGLTILQNLGVSIDELRRNVEVMVRAGREGSTGPDLPYTSGAKRVLEEAMKEARDLGHQYVGTEHLVIGLVREQKGIAARVLTDAGLTHDSLRTELSRLLASDSAPTEVTRRSATSRSLSYVTSSIPAKMDGRRATGEFEVQLKPMSTHAAEDATLSRMSIDKQFSGDLVGTSKGEMLAAMGGVKTSAGYVAIERVTATLDGKHGTFVLQHSSTMTRGVPIQNITVVPDSGTGDLAGITGSMAIRIENKKHFYDFDYRITPTP